MELDGLELHQTMVMQQLHLNGAVAVHCLTERGLQQLLEEAERLVLTLTDESAGQHQVREQLEFGELRSAADSPFTILRYALDERVRRAWWLFDQFGGFSEPRVQCRRPTGGGLRLQQDGPKCRNLAVVIPLKGSGEFATFTDRAGNGKKVIKTVPGDAIILRLPGFMRATDSPYYAVTDILDEHLAITYREETP